MDVDGVRARDGITSVNFKRAIRWLIQAGEQGLAEAWFVLSRIYVKPEFSQRSMVEAQAYLERAAAMGHANAQLECGINAWRTRRDSADSDVRAAYWLLKAAARGSVVAEKVLQKVAPASAPAAWLEQLGAQLTSEHIDSQPFLSARLELAVLFNLSRAEALLLDMHAADQGHCLVVDISASYGRSKRRLALLRTAAQRQALNRIMRVFDNVDCGPNGPEGNYRQRLYRLKTWGPA
jgi:TPR repeat protein